MQEHESNEAPTGWRRLLHPFGLTEFHRVVAVALATTTLLIALVTKLEITSHGRAESARTEAQVTSLQATTLRLNGENQVKFDWNTAFRTWRELDYRAAAALQAGDTSGASRYQELRDRVRDDSDLLDSKDYFPDSDSLAGSDVQPVLARYENDIYYHDTLVLDEEASLLEERNEFWHSQQNTYITVLAFLSAALFVMGLSLTAPRQAGRALVALSSVVVLAAGVYVALAWHKSQPELSDAAIHAYADGKASAYLAQNDTDAGRQSQEFDAALAAFDQALKLQPDYADALEARADTHRQRGELLGPKEEQQAANELHEAIHDYKDVIDDGEGDSSTKWNLGWSYYLVGDYDHAIEAYKDALDEDDSLTGVQGNLALAYLAAGNTDEAQKTLQQAMDQATSQITASSPPPESYWQLLEDMDFDFGNLALKADGASYAWMQAPPASAIQDAKTVQQRAADAQQRLETLSFDLHETRKPPPSTPGAASFSNLSVGRVIYGGDSPCYQPGSAFATNTDEVRIDFDYTGMTPGQQFTYRVTYNGVPNQLLGRTQAVASGDGSAFIRISYAYSRIFNFKPGFYAVQFYVDGRQVARAGFRVGDGPESASAPVCG